MKEIINKPETISDRELSITRILNAPRELVWKVWTEPEHIKHWWGPNGFTNTIQKMEVRTGGVWDFIMHGPDGVDYPNKITYIEVKKPERLVYNHGDEEKPEFFHVTVTFEEHGGKTKLYMCALFNTKEERDEVVKKFKADEGMKQTISRLEEYLIKM